MLIVGIVILIVFFIATSTIEKTLKSIKKQNGLVIELLQDIRDKNEVVRVLILKEKAAYLGAF